MSLCVLLSSFVFAIASPGFANEPGDEPVAALSDLAPEPALDVAQDLLAIEDLERQMDQELTADVSRMLDSIVTDLTAQQVRWLAQHYFDTAATGGRAPSGASPVALASPANSR
jgi:hypothetical protein